MEIEVDNFRIVLQDYQYNLEEIKTVKKDDGSESSRREINAYGMSLTWCIKEIARLRLKSREETVSLGRFLVLYKQEISRVERLVEIGAEV